MAKDEYSKVTRLLIPVVKDDESEPHHFVSLKAEFEDWQATFEHIKSLIPNETKVEMEEWFTSQTRAFELAEDGFDAVELLASNYEKLPPIFKKLINLPSIMFKTALIEYLISVDSEIIKTKLESIEPEIIKASMIVCIIDHLAITKPIERSQDGM